MMHKERILHLGKERGTHTHTHSHWASAGHTHTTADFRHIQSLGEGKEHRFISATITEGHRIQSRAITSSSVESKMISHKAVHLPAQIINLPGH